MLKGLTCYLSNILAFYLALGPWRWRSSNAHCDPELAKRIGETLGEEDWRGEGREGGGGGGGREAVLIKPSNPHLAGGELIKT